MRRIKLLHDRGQHRNYTILGNNGIEIGKRGYIGYF